MSEDLTAEATGETVGEAKWNALRELERRAPALDKAGVRFQVVTEGERGLLGVGATPARVLATVSVDVATSAARSRPADESPDAARIRLLLEHVTSALGLRCRVEVSESTERLTATCFDGDLGLLIGKHGQTIDAVQTLASAMLATGEERKEVVVDAEGYRERRRRTIESIALRAAEEAVRSQLRVELEPMTPNERRLVHERLKDVDGVKTESEGAEPHRYVVVAVV